MVSQPPTFNQPETSSSRAMDKKENNHDQEQDPIPNPLHPFNYDQPPQNQPPPQGPVPQNQGANDPPPRNQPYNPPPNNQNQNNRQPDRFPFRPFIVRDEEDDEENNWDDNGGNYEGSDEDYDVGNRYRYQGPNYNEPRGEVPWGPPNQRYQGNGNRQGFHRDNNQGDRKNRMGQGGGPNVNNFRNVNQGDHPRGNYAAPAHGVNGRFRPVVSDNPSPIAPQPEGRRIFKLRPNYMV